MDSSEWARQPPSGSVYQRIFRSIYDPEEKSFLGRTAKRWGIVLTFYLVFYAVLALMFAVCMGGLFYSLERRRPKYTLENSLIGVNPGLAFRPRPLDGVVHQYSLHNSSEYEPYLIQLQEFLQSYGNDSRYIRTSACSEEDQFGYPRSPCFFIKLNKIYDWEPAYYDLQSLPSEMPEDLKGMFSELETSEHKQVWVSCWEEKGNSTLVEYPWGMGLHNQFYPYRNQEGYKSPILAIKVTPAVNKHTFVRCRAWAKNIVYNKSLKEPSGYTRIHLYVEDNTRTNETDFVE